MSYKHTIDYYDKHSDLFVEGTLTADMSAHYEKFLAYIPEGGTIIDAGCGSGRDVKHFKEKGYRVQAFDYSEKMVEIAERHSGVPVIHCDFLEFEPSEKAHGIWACASLLHVDEKKQREILLRYKRFLHNEGVFFMSFKYGKGSYEKNGRRFFCHTLESLQDMIVDAEDYEILHLYTTEDVRKDRKDEMWSTAIIRLKG